MADEHFELQFALATIRELEFRYTDSAEEEAMAAGTEIACAEYSRENLTRIYQWKNGNWNISRLDRNSDAEIADALRLALGARTERAAIAVLTGLFGIEVPIASAILTAIDSNRYTILDFRALEALGNGTKSPYTIDFYLKYLRACKELAQQAGVELRTLDRAMWQWSYERSQLKACAGGA
ncbi:MAG: hypothetical protein AB7O65_06110 [Candidatus Korobacteraceae bacterium]